MVVDRIFFKNLLRILETDHNLVRNMDSVTETWKSSVDVTINQCKEMLSVAQYQEERKAVFSNNEEFVDIDSIEHGRILKISLDSLDIIDNEE